MRALGGAILAVITVVVVACSSGSGGAGICGKSVCARGYRCKLDSEPPPFCCGGTGASCTKDADCCSDYPSVSAPNACTLGTCSSIGNPCSSDGDCTGGAVCIANQCFKPRGATCAGDGECASAQCSGTCGLSHTGSGQGALCRTVADCAHGTCDKGQCQRVPGGAPCLTELDCGNGACTAGVCHCLHAGAVALSDVNNPGCCTNYVVNSYCATSPMSYCATSDDCFGAPCVSGDAGSQTCGCVGVGGICSKNADCCAGATQCMGDVCQ